MNDFAELSVRIKGNKTYGSGCLYKLDEVTGIVITAKHCIYNKETDSIYENLEIADYKKEILQILDSPIYPKDNKLDLAAIKVKLKRTYPDMLIANPVINQNIVFYGYPSHMEQNNECGTPLRGSITQIDKPDILKLVMNNELYSSFNSEQENTSGYSGSGVYVEIEGKCHLIGIVVILEAKGKHGIIQAIHVDHISRFFENEIGISLVQSCLVDFSIYLDEVIEKLQEIEGQENKIIYLIKESYEKNFSEITPQKIQNILNESLFYPYKKNFDFTNKLLWIGWLEILLCKIMQKNFNFEVSDFFKLSIPNKLRSGIHLFFTEDRTLQNFIGNVFKSEIYDRIDENDVVFVNNPSKKFLGDSIAKKISIEGIVRNIDHPQVYKRLSIDDPEEQKLFPIVHIEYLEDEIVRFLYETSSISAARFVEEFPEKLNEIFRQIEE